MKRELNPQTSVYLFIRIPDICGLFYSLTQIFYVALGHTRCSTDNPFSFRDSHKFEMQSAQTIPLTKRFSVCVSSLHYSSGFLFSGFFSFYFRNTFSLFGSSIVGLWVKMNSRKTGFAEHEIFSRYVPIYWFKI